MNDKTNGQPTVIRTERGLTIAGTRITLYALMDCLRADWPSKLIQDWFKLSDGQIAGVLSYIDEHKEEVEREYEKVVRQAKETRQYWEARNRNRNSASSVRPLPPERAALWEKLQDWKAKLEQS